MTDMITWLRAQLDEDEREVRDGWRLSDVEWALPACGERDHLLADIAAKQAILDLHEHTVKTFKRPPFNELTGEPQGPDYEVECAVCGWVDYRPEGVCHTVRILAYAYRHRPGYLPEWAPEGQQG